MRQNDGRSPEKMKPLLGRPTLAQAQQRAKGSWRLHAFRNNLKLLCLTPHPIHCALESDFYCNEAKMILRWVWPLSWATNLSVWDHTSSGSSKGFKEQKKGNKEIQVVWANFSVCKSDMYKLWRWVASSQDKIHLFHHSIEMVPQKLWTTKFI